MENRPLLSICIPTFNRASYLKECLDSIVCQFDDKEVFEKTEIVISDNASQDNTEEVVKEYQKRFNNIRYFRNKENIGFDLNLVNAIEKASGKYCCYLGDDDKIKNGALKFILEILKREEISVLTFRAGEFTKMEDVLAKDNLETAKDKLYFFNSYEEFLRKGECRGTFSTFIFNRDLWLSVVDRKNFTIGWLYYETILRILPKSQLKFCYIDYPLFLLGQDCSWVKNGQELFNFLNVKKLFEKVSSFGYDKKVYNEFFARELKKYPKRLLIMLLRSKGHDLECSFSVLTLIFKNFWQSPFYLFLAIIIFFIPNSLIKIIRDFKKKFLCPPKI